MYLDRLKLLAKSLFLLASAGLLGPLQILGQTPLEYFQTKQMAAVALAEGNHAEAAQRYSWLVAIRPDDPEVLHWLWIAKYRAGDQAGALSTAERLYGVLGSAPNLSYAIAGMHATEGRLEDALEWLNTSLADGFENRTDIAKDERFARFSSDSRFRKIAGITPPGLTRDEGWAYDLEYFLEEAQRLHADPKRPAFSSRFLDSVSDLRSLIPTLTDEQIVLRMMELAAILGDGHTAIYGPFDDSPITMDAGALPVLFYLFSDGLYVVDATPDWSHLTGARVERIGRLAPIEVLDRLHKHRGVDNSMTMSWLGVHFYLRRLTMLRGVGAIDTAKGVTLTLTAEEGDSSVFLEGGRHEFRRKLRSPIDLAEPPRYLRDVDANYWLEVISGSCSVYLQFNQVRDEQDGASIEEFAQHLLDVLSSSGSRNLIVDLRHNNGGNNSLLRPLLRVLVSFDLGEDNQLFVITGRNTFSAAQNFINRVERLTDAIFVGEPSSSSPNFVGEETDLVLPWSRLRGSISSKYWQDSDPGDDRPWISPDIPIVLSSTDYFSGVDPVMGALDPLLTCAP